MHKPAKEPNDLERFFVERANAGDVEGIVALYEPNATLACGGGEVVVGLDQIRKFFIGFLASRPQLTPSLQAPALCSGDLALTSSRLDKISPQRSPDASRTAIGFGPSTSLLWGKERRVAAQRFIQADAAA